jgi:YjbE family integral membrane protein
MMNQDPAIGWEIFEIIWINILLSGDNAILIALACRQLPQHQRRWGVFLGALGGVILRVVFTLIVVELLGVPLLKAVGSLLLLLVAIKLLIDETEPSDVKAKPNLWGAVMSIIMADAVMSLDNVIAIAAAARGSARLIIFGLVLSVPIVMFGAGFLLKALERFPLLVWAGAALLGWVSGEMMASDVIVSNYLSNYIDLSMIGASGVVISAFVVKLLRSQRSAS